MGLFCYNKDMMKPFPVIPKTTLFLAGGCVRDTLLGLEPKDRDFVAITDLTFPEFVEAVNTVGKVFQEREEFLVVRARIEHESIDLAFPRSESNYEDQRHPSFVERVSTLHEDAGRRDFTINAMFMDEAGEVQDFFGGTIDLADRLIRGVGKPKDRFIEDPLRILRGIRFSCRLGFDIHSTTMMRMITEAELIRTVAAERIREEVNGALKANPVEAINLFKMLDLFPIFAEKRLTFTTTLKG